MDELKKTKYSSQQEMFLFRRKVILFKRLKKLNVNKRHFFVFAVTVLIVISYCLSIIGSALYSNFSTIYSKKQDYITLVLDSLIHGNSNGIVEFKSNLNQETSQIKQISPFASSIISNYTTEFSDISTTWIEDIHFIHKYSFSQNGFENTVDKTEFTDDLVIFFNQLPTLRDKIVEFENKLGWLNLFASVIASESLIHYFNLISSIVDLANIVLANQQSILQALGHFSNQNYLLLTQNTGEARPTGGFNGSYMIIEYIKGKMRISPSESIYNLQGGINNHFITHPATYLHNLNSTNLETIPSTDIHDSNYFNCFKDSAKMISQVFENNKYGFALNGVIVINPQVLTTLIDDTVSIQIDNLYLNKQNILDEIERLTSYQTDTPQNPKSKISTIFVKVLQSLKTISPQLLFQNISLQLLNRNLQLWFKDYNIDKLSRDLGVSVNGSCQDMSSTPIISPLISNLSGDKRNLVTENRFNIYIENALNANRVHVKYQQLLPSTPSLKRGFNDISPLTFYGLQIPPNAFNISISSPEQAALPLVRPYSKLLSQKYDNLGYNILPEMEKIYSSIHIINNGFVYSQPDNSLVVGLYLQDNEHSEVQVTFDIPKTKEPIRHIEFLGQSGLQSPSLSLGNGVTNSHSATTKLITNPDLIQAGLDLVF